MTPATWFVTGVWPRRRWALITSCIEASGEWRQVRITPLEPAILGSEHWIILPADEAADLDGTIATWGLSQQGQTLVDDQGAIWLIPKAPTLLDGLRHRTVVASLGFAVLGALYAGWHGIATARTDAAKGAAIQFAYERDDGSGLRWERTPHPVHAPYAILVRTKTHWRPYLPQSP